MDRSTPPAPEAGQTVYDLQGHRGEYVLPLGEAHLVRPWVVIPSWDGEDLYSEPGGIEVWPQVYLAPPVAILEDDIVRLQGEIEAKRRELAEATDEVSGFFRDEKARQERIKRHEDLARLDDFISGKISHVVKRSYGAITIEEFKEAIEQTDRYSRDGLKLLTLFGRPDGGLQWKVNRYSDGSGQDMDVFPCQSAEEARSVATSLLAKEFNSASTYWLHQAIKSADALDIPVPADARERCRVGRLEELTKVRKAKLAELEKLDAELAEIAPTEAGSDAETCIACRKSLVTGDRYYPDASGGFIHDDCCGPERESYTNADGEPLGPDDPIPEPAIWGVA